MFGDMEGNDYLCRSWFKLLIRGLVPLHNCGSRLCERAAFYFHFLSFLLKSFKKHKFPAIFLQKSFVLQFSFVFLQTSYKTIYKNKNIFSKR